MGGEQGLSQKEINYIESEVRVAIWLSIGLSIINIAILLFIGFMAFKETV